MERPPFSQSFWIHEGLLCAGCYPGDLEPATRETKLRGLLDCGIRRVINLMEADEQSYGGRPFEPYSQRLRELADDQKVAIDCLNLPTPDARAPRPEILANILEHIQTGLQQQIPTYLHCWGGHGRTGTVIACHLIQQGCAAQEAIDKVVALRADLPRSHYPFEGDQERFIRSWPQEKPNQGGSND